MTTQKELIERLQKRYKPEDVLAVIIWQVDDVLGRAKEREIEITREQAEKIVSRIDRRKDATLGITWVTIDCALDDFI